VDAAGLFACWVALRLPVALHAPHGVLGVRLHDRLLLVLVLIPGIGHESNGSRGWFVVAGLSMQPSELTKIAFAIWGAASAGDPAAWNGLSLRELLCAADPRRGDRAWP